MRCANAVLVALVSLAPSHSGLACNSASGFIADPTCAVVEPFAAGELYAVATGIGNPSTDLLFNLHSKGELPSSGQEILHGPDGGWSVGDGWSSWPSCTRFIALTLPGGRVAIDSHRPGDSFGVVIPQRIGDSVPSGHDAGIGLVLPGDRSSYEVTSGAISGRFPQRLRDGGVRLAFAPLAELNDKQVGSPGCSYGGEAPDLMLPLGPGEVPVLGHVVGYNVFRIPACATTIGSAAEFGAALVDGTERSGWVGYVDLLAFDPSVANDGAVSPGPNDRDWADAADLVNPDGVMYSGDEVILFTDLAATGRPDAWRTPRADQDYWYAVQPAWNGRIADFAAVGFGESNAFFGDHRIDLDGDGRHDAIDLHDGTTTPEFISPQAEPENGGHGGLGLTHAGLPLVGPPMYAPRAFTTASPGECVLVVPGPVRPPRPPTRPPFRVP